MRYKHKAFGAHMKYKLLLLFFMIFACIAEVTAQEIKVEPEELLKWDFWGTGLIAADVDLKQVLLTEFPGSKGVMLVSPGAYGKDIVVSFRVKPLTPETVLVVLLSASERGDNNGLYLPSDYDGSMGYIINNSENYFVAFHNAAHNTTPFIRKFPQGSSEKIYLAIAEKNVMDLQEHNVEVGNIAGKISLTIDGEKIIEAKDKEMLSYGHMAFRIRGTKDRIASCLIKDVVIRQVEANK